MGVNGVPLSRWHHPRLNWPDIQEGAWGVTQALRLAAKQQSAWISSTIDDQELVTFRQHPKCWHPICPHVVWVPGRTEYRKAQNMLRESCQARVVKESLRHQNTPQKRSRKFKFPRLMLPRSVAVSDKLTTVGTDTDNIFYTPTEDLLYPVHPTNERCISFLSWPFCYIFGGALLTGGKA